VLAFSPAQVAPDLGSHLAFGAKLAIRVEDVDPPHDDGVRRRADRGPFLGQGPASVDRVARVHGVRKLPVEPRPLLDRRHRHVDRAQPDGDRDEQRWWGDAGVARGGFDREGREIAGHTGEQRDL
jgi:hypothetical protein